jgi:hypothetical protein
MDVGEVSGTVTLDGQPLENALVTFTPEGGGRGASGVTDASGKYLLATAGQAGAVPGTHRVTVTTLNQGQATNMADVPSDSEAYMKQATGVDTSAYDKAETQEKIPAKYNTESTLVKEVTAGTNVIDLQLTSE